MGKKYEFIRKGPQYSLYKSRENGSLWRRYNNTGKWVPHQKKSTGYSKTY